MCLTKIYSVFFSYSTDKTESPCGNPRYTQCLKCFSYLLTAVCMFLRELNRQDKRWGKDPALEIKY